MYADLEESLGTFQVSVVALSSEVLIEAQFQLDKNLVPE